MDHLHARIIVGPPIVARVQQQYLDAQHKGHDKGQRTDEERELGQQHDRLEDHRYDYRLGRDQAHEDGIEEVRQLLLALDLDVRQMMAFPTCR